MAVPSVPAFIKGLSSKSTSASPTGSSTDTADKPGQDEIMVHHERLSKIHKQLGDAIDDMKNGSNGGPGDLPSRRGSE